MKRKTLERPAFMMYAANTLAKREFRSMTFAERGLWITMVLECWPNQEIPADVDQLADYLRCSIDEIRRMLPKVMWDFDQTDEDIFCPSLEKYRDEQDARIAKQAAGGKRGAATTNAGRKTKDTSVSKHPASTPRATRRGSVESLGQVSSNQIKPSQPLKKELSSDALAFVDGMERAEASVVGRDYERASNGE